MQTKNPSYASPASKLAPGPIGVFDSGYGGLTILKEIRKRLPQYDYIYLGDNARAPYGTRSFDVIFDFTLQAVEELFSRGCNLVILACNTASAKALRTIQQTVLPHKYPGKRVLGVIRPTVEAIADVTDSGHVALLATPGTVRSHSYKLEVEKMSPSVSIVETECPMWVYLVETNEATGPGADYFVKKYIDQAIAEDPKVDTLLLGCTHYPLLLPKIKQYAPEHIKIMTQGHIVSESLADYLVRHPEMNNICSKNGEMTFLTSENPEIFDRFAAMFLDYEVRSSRITL